MSYTDDSSSNVFLLHNSRQVVRTVRKARGIVVDVLHLNDDCATPTATVSTITAATVISHYHLQTIWYSRLLHWTCQCYYTRRRCDGERPVVLLVICQVQRTQNKTPLAKSAILRDITLVILQTSFLSLKHVIRRGVLEWKRERPAFIHFF